MRGRSSASHRSAARRSRRLVLNSGIMSDARLPIDPSLSRQGLLDALSARALRDIDDERAAKKNQKKKKPRVVAPA